VSSNGTTSGISQSSSFVRQEQNKFGEDDYGKLKKEVRFTTSGIIDDSKRVVKLNNFTKVKKGKTTDG
jgi:hypothetical protein